MVKKIKKTKRKLKKKIKLILILLIIIVGVIITYKIINSNEKIKEVKTPVRTSKEIITNILTYNIEESINEEFLNWINNEYSTKRLEELENYLKENEYNKNIWHKLTSKSLIVLQDEYKEVRTNKTKNLTPKQNINEVLLSFVGDVSLADDWYIMPKYDERKKKVYGILSEDVVNIMTSSDIMVANNEFTISNRGSKMP